MEQIKGLTISEADYNLANGNKGKIAVFLYTGGAEPRKILDYAVMKYVDNNGYNELIDAHLDNPWMRVIISDINNMKQAPFDAETNRL